MLSIYFSTVRQRRLRRDKPFSERKRGKGSQGRGRKTHRERSGARQDRVLHPRNQTSNNTH